MMTRRLLHVTFAALIVSAAWTPRALAAPISDLYNTGLAALGAVDPSWDIAYSGHSSDAYVTDGPYLAQSLSPADDATSKWISLHPFYYKDGSDPQAYYDFTTTFTLPAENDLSTAQFEFRVAADGVLSSVKLNNTSISSANSWNSWSTVNTNLVAGTNTLTFQVYNQWDKKEIVTGTGKNRTTTTVDVGNPIALRVEFRNSDSGLPPPPPVVDPVPENQPPSVPEPASLLVLGTGLLVSAGQLRRRK